MNRSKQKHQTLRQPYSSLASTIMPAVHPLYPLCLMWQIRFYKTKPLFSGRQIVVSPYAVAGCWKLVAKGCVSKTTQNEAIFERFLTQMQRNLFEKQLNCFTAERPAAAD